MSDVELHAIAAYLRRGLRPVTNKVPDSEDHRTSGPASTPWTRSECIRRRHFRQRASGIHSKYQEHGKATGLRISNPQRGAPKSLAD